MEVNMYDFDLGIEIKVKNVNIKLLPEEGSQIMIREE